MSTSKESKLSDSVFYKGNDSKSQTTDENVCVTRNHIQDRSKVLSPGFS